MNHTRTITTTQLGSYLDGWADLIEGMGSKADDVKNEIVRQLTERNMPDVQVEEVTAKPGVFIKDYRTYIITTTYPRATTTIYVGAYGNDLYTSWRSFFTSPLKAKLLKNVILIISALIFLLFFIALIGYTYNRTRTFITGYNWGPTGAALFEWLIYAAGIFVVLLIAIAIFGQIRKKNPGAYLDLVVLIVAVIIALFLAALIKNPGEVMNPVLEDIGGFVGSLAKHYFQRILDGIFYVFYFVCGFVISIMIAGLIVKRNIWYFLTIQPNDFDTEDLTAMNLAVHKSIQRALDLQGISTEKLRLKREFKGGRKNIVV